jgi:hypothetical protein
LKDGILKLMGRTCTLVADVVVDVTLTFYAIIQTASKAMSAGGETLVVP